MQKVEQYIQIGQVVLSILLIGAILLQQRGASLGSSFGGGGATYSSRRGLEKTLFIATIILGTLFFIASIAALVVTRN